MGATALSAYRGDIILARAAAAVGIDGLFLETHPDPDQSPSDGPNMVPLGQLRSVLQRVLLPFEMREQELKAELVALQHALDDA